MVEGVFHCGSSFLLLKKSSSIDGFAENKKIIFNIF